MILFELLQVAIDVKDGSSLTATSSDWKKFYSFCKKTGITWYWFFCFREDWLMSKEFDVVMVWSCATDREAKYRDDQSLQGTE